MPTDGRINLLADRFDAETLIAAVESVLDQPRENFCRKGKGQAYFLRFSGFCIVMIDRVGDCVGQIFVLLEAHLGGVVAAAGAG